MDKIEKYLRKLTKSERTLVRWVIERVLLNQLDTLDVKKLSGHVDVFRVRVGATRVIYRKQGDTIRLLEVARRDEGIYRKF